MNIKLKAALEVVGIGVIIAVVVAGVRAILATAVASYGVENVLNGIAFTFVSITAYVLVGLLYDSRVAKLQYKQKLNETVKK